MARGKKQHGGARTPANPAPVSAPQSGARTDGGPGSTARPTKFQPAPGEPYGQNQQLEQLASAAPVPAAGGPPDGGSVSAPAAPSPVPIGPEGIFGPTQQPDVPVTSGLEGPDAEPLDADTALRLLYAQYNSPWLLRLMSQDV